MSLLGKDRRQESDGLDVRDLSFTYARSKASAGFVDAISFTASAGRVTCILGPSGSGKSTILKLLAGHLKPERGRILIGGRDVADCALGSRSTATVSQEAGLLREFTVKDNIAAALHAARIDARAGSVSAGQLLSFFAIEHLLGRRVSEISRGEAQRVAIVRALVVRPTLLMLDEPTAALDMLNKDRLMAMLTDVKARFPSTIVLLVSHDREFCLQLADHLVVIDAGRVVWEGDPGGILDGSLPARAVQILGLGFVLQGAFEGGSFVIPATAPGRVDLTLTPAEGFAAAQEGFAAVLVLRRDVRAHALEVEPNGGQRPAQPVASVERSGLNERGDRLLDLRLPHGDLWRGVVFVGDTCPERGGSVRLTISKTYPIDH